MTDTKLCRKCDIDLPLGDFGADASRPDGKHPYCRVCRNGNFREAYKTNPVVKEQARWRAIKHRYGLTRAQFDALWAEQSGCCAICKQEIRQEPGFRMNAATDHCHVSGKVRGLLCQPCNRGLGHFNDSADLLRAAAAYIE